MLEKDIAPETANVLVPSMILQPLVENSIKHGLARTLGGGRIVIRSRRVKGHVAIEVVDNGVGMSEERLDGATDGRYWSQYVSERLKVIYGASYPTEAAECSGRRDHCANGGARAEHVGASRFMIRPVRRVRNVRGQRSGLDAWTL